MIIRTDRGDLPITEEYKSATEAVKEGYKFYFRNYDGVAIYIKTDGQHGKFATIKPVRKKGSFTSFE